MSQYSDAEAGRAGGCYSVCGPSPLRVSVLCLLVISFWALLVLILHLDKKVASVQDSLASTEQLLLNMEDSATLFRQTCGRCLTDLCANVSNSTVISTTDLNIHISHIAKNSWIL